MSVVEDKVTELVNAIQDTNEYKRYQEAKNKLHANPELEQIVFAFRQKNYQIQNSKNVDLFWEVDHLEQGKYRYPQESGCRRIYDSRACILPSAAEN